MGKAGEMKASNSVWKEQLTFEKMVDELTISESMIKKATKFCIKQQKWYKHIVQVIERYAMREKSRKSEKLQIFYIIDGILRRLAREKNKKLLKKFSGRFNRNIVTTVKNLLTGSLPSERQKIKRVVTLWAKSVLLFSPENVKVLKELVQDLPDGKSKPAAYSPRKSSSKHKPAFHTPAEPSKPALQIPSPKSVPQTLPPKSIQEEEPRSVVKSSAPEKDLELMLKYMPSPTEDPNRGVKSLAPESELELMLKDIPSPTKEIWQKQSSSAKSTLDAIESLMLPTEVKSKPNIPAEVDDSAFDYGDNQSIEETRQSLKRKFGNSSLVSPPPKKRKSLLSEELPCPKPQSPGRLEPTKNFLIENSLPHSTTPDDNTPEKPKIIVNHPGYVVKDDDPTGTTVMSTCIWAKFSRDQTELLKGHCERLGEVVDFHIVNDGDPSEAFISFRTRCSALFVKLHLLKGNDPGCDNLPRLMKVGWGKTPGVVDFDFANGVGKVTVDSKQEKLLQ